MSMIEDDMDDIGQTDIYVLPPGDGQNSDENSGDEECTDGSINSLPYSQLNNPAEAVITWISGKRTLIGGTEEMNDQVRNDNVYYIQASELSANLLISAKIKLKTAMLTP